MLTPEYSRAAIIDPPSLQDDGETREGLEQPRVPSLAHRMGEGARRAGEGCLSAIPDRVDGYGRGAIALGFAAHKRRHETTQDVDVIIPLGRQPNRRSSNCQPLCYLNHDEWT